MSLALPVRRLSATVLSALILLVGMAAIAQARAAQGSRAPAPGASVPASPRASLPAIERQAICVTCKIPLPEARSPQADAERALIRSLIARGLDEAQIKRVLVAEYGPAVLALPPASGFDLLVYIIPAAVVLLALLLLAIALPRWRRRPALEETVWGPPRIALSSAEAERLERDLARFDDY
jgi:cytochrome c-type biogenesis protein CcmH/NrfF